jgi:hypothetical protein
MVRALAAVALCAQLVPTTSNALPAGVQDLDEIYGGPPATTLDGNTRRRGRGIEDNTFSILRHESEQSAFRVHP